MAEPTTAADELAAQFLKKKRKAAGADELAAQFLAAKRKAEPAAASADELAARFLAERRTTPPPKPKVKPAPKPTAPSVTPPSKKPLADIKGYEEEPVVSPEMVARGVRPDIPPFLAPPKYTKAQIKAPLGQQLKAGAVAGLQTVGGILAGIPGKPIQRLGAPLYPVRDLLNVAAEEEGKLRRKYGDNIPQSARFLSTKRVLERVRPWQAFKKGLLKGEDTPFEAFTRRAREDPAYRAVLEKLGGPAVWDFIGGFAVDAPTGRLQAKAAVPVARAGIRAQAAVEKALPEVARRAGKVPLVGPKAEAVLEKAARYPERRRVFRETGEIYGRRGAQAEAITRRAADLAKEVRQSSQRAMRAGAQVRGKEPITGRTVNRLAEQVGDWLKAGEPNAAQLARQTKQLAAAQKALPKRQKVAAQAQQVVAREQDRLRDAQQVARLQQGELETARKAQLSAATAARKAREQAQGAQRDAAVAQRVAEERAQSVAQLRARQQKQIAAQKQGKQPTLPVSTGMLQAARSRANAAQQKVQQATQQAEALRQQARGSWDVARQAGQPVTKATREAGKAQQALFTQQKAATRATKQADRLTGRAQSAQTQAILLQHQTSPLFLKGVQQARRGQELQKVQAEAQRLGLDYREIERLGKMYQQFADDVGQELVRVGALSAEAFERLRGSYLPRLYLMHSLKPAEAERTLRQLEKAGTIAPEIAGNIRRSLRGKMARGAAAGAGEDFTKARVVEEPMEPALGRIVSREVTPAMSRYAQSAAREIGEARAMEEIASNPRLAVRKELATGEQAANWDTIEEGALKGHYVHPGVKDYVKFKDQPELMYGALKRWNPAVAEGWRTAHQTIRKLWLSLPMSGVNNGVGNYTLGQSTAAINGAGYSLPGFATASRELQQFGKTRKASGFLNEPEALEVIGGQIGVIPAEALTVRGGFGAETTWERLRPWLNPLGKPLEKWLDLQMRGPEKAARYYLYKELRLAGKSPQEAARITNAAMIDYTDVGPIRRALDQNNVLPFITFPTKAIFQYANMAARRPDLFQASTGERLRDFLDIYADEIAAKQGKPALARKKRERRDVTLLEFPIPGQFDVMGQQRYLRAPIGAPVLQMFPAQPEADIVSERIKSAFPLFRVPLELAMNRSAFTGREIVPLGLPPGGEALALQTLHAAGAAAPIVRTGSDLYHALTQTTRYPSAFTGKQEVGQVLLRFLTGISEREGAGETSRQGLLRAAGRMKASVHQPYREHARAYTEGLQEERIQIDGRLMEGLRRQTGKSHEVKGRLKDAVGRYEKLLTTEEKSGEDRMRAIEGQLQYIFALKERLREVLAEEKAMQSPAP